MRNTILSLYQPSHLAKLIPTMQDFIESSTQNLDSKDFTFSDLSLKLATDVIGKAAFGVDFGLSKPESCRVSDDRDDDQVQEFINQHIYSTTQLKMDLSGSFSIILGLLIPILQEPFRQILKRIPGTMDWKFERTNNNLSNRLDGIVHNRMKQNDLSSKDFLSLILRTRESESAAKNAFTEDYISAVTYEHLLAGSATTSFTLSSIVYLVSCHPDVEKKVLEEVDAFGPHDQMPTAHDLQHSFPYLDQVGFFVFCFVTVILNRTQCIFLIFELQVIKEAMRVYTVSPLVARETSAEVNIGGYVLPKVRLH